MSRLSLPVEYFGKRHIENMGDPEGRLGTDYAHISRKEGLSHTQELAVHGKVVRPSPQGMQRRAARSEPCSKLEQSLCPPGGNS